MQMNNQGNPHAFFSKVKGPLCANLLIYLGPEKVLALHFCVLLALRWKETCKDKVF